MYALVATVEVLAQFKIIVEPTLLSMPLGETPDFVAFARQAAQEEVRVVIAATHQKRLARGLAAACQVPTIRIPLAADASVAAGLAVLTEASEDHEAALDRAETGSFATVALGEAGARNAAFLAISILALNDEGLSAAWRAFREQQTQAVLSQPPPSG